MNGRTQLIEIVKEYAEKRIASAWWVTVAVCSVYLILTFTFAEPLNLIGIPYTILITWWYIRSIKKGTKKKVDDINQMYDEHENSTER